MAPPTTRISHHAPAKIMIATESAKRRVKNLAD